MKKFMVMVFALAVMVISAVAEAAYIPDGWYQIISVNAPGKCLDVCGGAFRRGDRIILFENRETPNQMFYVRNVGDEYFYLQINDELVVDVNGNNDRNGAKLIAWPSTGNNNQLWRAVTAPDGESYFLETAMRRGAGMDCTERGSRNYTEIQIWDFGYNNAWQQWILRRVR